MNQLSSRFAASGQFFSWNNRITTLRSFSFIIPRSKNLSKICRELLKDPSINDGRSLLNMGERKWCRPSLDARSCIYSNTSVIATYESLLNDLPTFGVLLYFIKIMKKKKKNLRYLYPIDWCVSHTKVSPRARESPTCEGNFPVLK
jgi:hypothetical protein